MGSVADSKQPKTTNLQHMVCCAAERVEVFFVFSPGAGASVCVCACSTSMFSQMLIIGLVQKRDERLFGW